VKVIAKIHLHTKAREKSKDTWHEAKLDIIVLEKISSVITVVLLMISVLLAFILRAFW
jgi:hypothetical protein